MHAPSQNPLDPRTLMVDLEHWAAELGFAALGIANIDLSLDEPRLLDWLQQGFHGEMRYMSRHGAETQPPGQSYYQGP